MIHTYEQLLERGLDSVLATTRRLFRRRYLARREMEKRYAQFSGANRHSAEEDSQHGMRTGAYYDMETTKRQAGGVTHVCVECSQGWCA